MKQSVTRLSKGSFVRTTKNTDETKYFDPKTAAYLRTICKQFPIIVSSINFCNLDEKGQRFRYSTACSLTEFSKWLAGKQKSVEFHRAKIIKECLIRHSPDLNLKTKTLVLWLREEGLTPIPLVKKDEQYCLVCGRHGSASCCDPKIYESYCSRSILQAMIKIENLKYLNTGPEKPAPHIDISRFASRQLLESLFVSSTVNLLKLNCFESSNIQTLDFIALVLAD
jgi:hypothetical protein